MHFAVLLSVDIPETNNKRDEFSRQIHEKVDAAMEPFYYDPDNPDYLVFCDRTADIKEWYARAENQNKYASYEEFAEKELYMDYSPELDAYGEYSNPNAFYDYYSLGHSIRLLVKKSCMEYFVDENAIDTRNAPDGHLWVCAARKKDIEWKTMYDFEIPFAKKRFLALQKYYYTGKADKELQSRQYILCDEGIKNGYSYHPDEDFFYYRGETMEEYLKRIGYLPGLKYPVFTLGYIQDGVYQCMNDITCDTEIEQTTIWMRQVEEYISGLSEESVLVVVSCHS